MNAGETLKDPVSNAAVVAAIKADKPKRRTRRSDGSETSNPVMPVLEAQRPLAGPTAAMTEATTKTDGYVIPNHPAKAMDVVIVNADKGIVTGTRKKIAICGFASSSRDEIPIPDPSWEVWGLNQLYRHIRRADRWFDIHYDWNHGVVPGTEGGYDQAIGVATTQEPQGRKEPSYLHWLAHCGLPMYQTKHVPEIPTSVRYPLEQVIAHHATDYFTSTISYMVALAIMEIDQRVEAAVAKLSKRKIAEQGGPIKAMQRAYAEYQIGLWGIDLVVGSEYFHEKPCAEYWIGCASARGITVWLPSATALCKQRFRYGYQREPESTIKLSEIEAHQAEIKKEIDECVKKFDYLNGIRDSDERWRQLIELRVRGLGQ